MSQRFLFSANICNSTREMRGNNQASSRVSLVVLWVLVVSAWMLDAVNAQVCDDGFVCTLDIATMIDANTTACHYETLGADNDPTDGYHDNFAYSSGYAGSETFSPSYSVYDWNFGSAMNASLNPWVEVGDDGNAYTGTLRYVELLNGPQWLGSTTVNPVGVQLTRRLPLFTAHISGDPTMQVDLFKESLFTTTNASLIMRVDATVVMCAFTNPLNFVCPGVAGTLLRHIDLVSETFSAAIPIGSVVGENSVVTLDMSQCETSAATDTVCIGINDMEVYFETILSCDDTDPCTVTDVCDSGVCAGVPKDCDDGNACTIDSCDATGTCVHDPVTTNDVVCRPKAGPCDVPDYCFANFGICRPDQKAPSGTVCRDVAGLCDVAETCNGFSIACPADAFLPMGTPCRVNSTDCFEESTCPGGSSFCPEVIKANGTPCSDGDDCETGDTCLDGDCIPGPVSMVCDDMNVCTVDGCANGACVFLPIDAEMGTYIDTFEGNGFGATSFSQGTFSWTVFMWFEDGDVIQGITFADRLFNQDHYAFVNQMPGVLVPSDAYLFGSSSGQTIPNPYGAGVDGGVSIRRAVPIPSDSTVDVSFEMLLRINDHTPSFYSDTEVDAVMLVEFRSNITAPFTMAACIYRNITDFHLCNDTYDAGGANSIEYSTLVAAGSDRLFSYDIAAYASEDFEFRIRVPECALVDDSIYTASNGEWCAAVMQVEIMINFTMCDDGDLCTIMDTCVSGVCEGMPVDCSHLDTQCTLGACNATTGMCFAMPINENQVCTTGPPCFSDVCQNGVCIGDAPTDCTSFDILPIVVGVCNTTLDACVPSFQPSDGPCSGPAVECGEYQLFNGSCLLVPSDTNCVGLGTGCYEYQCNFDGVCKEKNPFLIGTHLEEPSFTYTPNGTFELEFPTVLGHDTFLWGIPVFGDIGSVQGNLFDLPPKMLMLPLFEYQNMPTIEFDLELGRAVSIDLYVNDVPILCVFRNIYEYAKSGGAQVVQKCASNNTIEVPTLINLNQPYAYLLISQVVSEDVFYLNSTHIDVHFVVGFERDCSIRTFPPTHFCGDQYPGNAYVGVRNFQIVVDYVDGYLRPTGTACSVGNCARNSTCSASGVCIPTLDACGVCLLEDDITGTAHTINVTHYEDVINPNDEYISLREAISIAKARNLPVVTINMPTERVYTLTSYLDNTAFPVGPLGYQDDDDNCYGDLDVRSDHGAKIIIQSSDGNNNRASIEANQQDFFLLLNTFILNGGRIMDIQGGASADVELRSLNMYNAIMTLNKAQPIFYAAEVGAGLRIYDAGTVAIDNCVFYSNEIQSVDQTLSGNEAFQASGGAGVGIVCSRDYTGTSSVTITNGGIYTNTVGLLVGFSSNAHTLYGGGLFVSADETCRVLLNVTNTQFNANQATNNDGINAALVGNVNATFAATNFSNAFLQTGTFTTSFVPGVSSGGALRMGHYNHLNTSVPLSMHVTLDDCLFEGNDAGMQGTAIAVSELPDKTLCSNGFPVEHDISLVVRDSRFFKNQFIATFPNNPSDFIGGTVYMACPQASLDVDTSHFDSNIVTDDDDSGVNRADTGSGGAIFLARGANAVVRNTRFEENVVQSEGGALAVVGGSSITVSNSVFERNFAGHRLSRFSPIDRDNDGDPDIILSVEYVFDTDVFPEIDDFGGALMCRSSFCSLERCTLYNGGAGQGGAVYVLASEGNNATLLMSQCTIYNNTAGGGVGGAVALGCMNQTLDNVFVTLEACTVVGNVAEPASPSTGGIQEHTLVNPLSSTSLLTMYNTAVTGNVGEASAGQSIDLHLPTPGTFLSQGYNLIEDQSGMVLAALTLTDISPVTNGAFDGPVMDNGGSVLSLLPAAGNDGVDAGDNMLLGTLITDARGTGFSRSVGFGVDIGAAEGSFCHGTGECEAQSNLPFAIVFCSNVTDTCELQLLPPDGPCTGPAVECGTYGLYNGTCYLVPSDEDCRTPLKESCIEQYCDLSGQCNGVSVFSGALDTGRSGTGEDFVFSKTDPYAVSGLSVFFFGFDVTINGNDPSSTNSSSSGNVFKIMDPFQQRDFPNYSYNGGYIQFDLTISDGMAVTVYINGVPKVCYREKDPVLGHAACVDEALVSAIITDTPNALIAPGYYDAYYPDTLDMTTAMFVDQQVEFTLAEMNDPAAMVSFQFSFVRECAGTVCDELLIDVSSYSVFYYSSTQQIYYQDGTECNILSPGDVDLFCSVRDECRDGECVITEIRSDCDDGNVCTVDTCSDATDSCMFTPLPDMGAYISDMSTSSATSGSINWQAYSPLLGDGLISTNPWFELNGDNEFDTAFFSDVGFIVNTPYLGVPADSYVIATFDHQNSGNPFDQTISVFSEVDGGRGIYRYTPINVNVTSVTLMFVFNLKTFSDLNYAFEGQNVLLAEVSRGPLVYDNFTVVGCFFDYDPGLCFPYDPTLTVDTSFSYYDQFDVTGGELTYYIRDLPNVGVSRLATIDITDFASEEMFIRLRVPRCRYPGDGVDDDDTAPIPFTDDDDTLFISETNPSFYRPGVCAYFEMVEVAIDLADCDDGDLCTFMDSCSGGTCAGMPVDCSHLTTACLQGMCDPMTGGCITVPRREGMSCNDGMACTNNDLCNNGTCVGTLNCAQFDTQCTAGQCSSTTGECIASPTNEGGACSITTDTLRRTSITGNCSIAIGNPFIYLDVYGLLDEEDLCYENNTCQVGECVGLRPNDAICDASIGSDCIEGVCMMSATLNCLNIGGSPVFSLENRDTTCVTEKKPAYTPCPAQFAGAECGFWGCNALTDTCELFSFDNGECNVFGGSCRMRECNVTDGQCIDGFKRAAFNSPPSIWEFATTTTHPTGGFIGLTSNTVDAFSFKSDPSQPSMMVLAAVILTNTTFSRTNISVPAPMIKPYESALLSMNMTASSFSPEAQYEFEMEVRVNGAPVLCIRQELPPAQLPPSMCNPSVPSVVLAHDTKTPLQVVLPAPVVSAALLTLEMEIIQATPSAGDILIGPSTFITSFPGLTLDVEDVFFEFLEPAFFEDGTVCDVSGCSNGFCQNCTCQATVMDCAYLSDDCNVGSCNVTGNVCLTTPINEGGVCDDGELCTDDGMCASGICTGAPPTDCTAFDSQCTVGVCNATTGACYSEPANEGMACSDGDPCTENDVCGNSGVCAGTPKDCSAEDEMCGTASCNPLTGECNIRTPLLPDGTACNDNGVDIIDCGANECVSGACTFVPVDSDCDTLEFCANMVCNVATTRCDLEIVGSSLVGLTGKPCTSGLLCFVNERCDSTGNCGNGTLVTDCDGDLCTLGDGCVGDVCTPGATMVDCSDVITDCHPKECNPDTGLCEDIPGPPESVSSTVVFMYVNSTPPAVPGLQSISASAGEFWLIDPGAAPAASNGSGTIFQKTTSVPLLDFPARYTATVQVSISTSVIVQNTGPGTSQVNSLVLTVGTFSTAVEPDLASQTFDVPLSAFDVGGTAMVTLEYVSISVDCNTFCDRLFIEFSGFNVHLYPITYEPDGTLCDPGFCLSSGMCDIGVCNSTNSAFLCSALDDECNVGVCVSNTTCVAMPANEGETCDLSCTLVGSVTYADQFAVTSFSNSDGTEDWSMDPWVESGDDGLPTPSATSAGAVYAGTTHSGIEPSNTYSFVTNVIPNPYSVGDGVLISRDINLALPYGDYVSATLTFETNIYSVYVPVVPAPTVLLVQAFTTLGGTQRVACIHRGDATLCDPYAAPIVLEVTSLPLGSFFFTRLVQLDFLPFLSEGTARLELRVPFCGYTGISGDTGTCAYVHNLELLLEVQECVDFTPCTTPDTCQNGTCTEGPAVDCTFLNTQCTTGACNATNGDCYAININEGMLCDDADPMTSSGMCVSGVCVPDVDCSVLTKLPYAIGIYNTTTMMCELVLVTPDGPCNGTATECGEYFLFGGACTLVPNDALCINSPVVCQQGMCACDGTCQSMVDDTVMEMPFNNDAFVFTPNGINPASTFLFADAFLYRLFSGCICGDLERYGDEMAKSTIFNSFPAYKYNGGFLMYDARVEAGLTVTAYVNGEPLACNHRNDTVAGQPNCFGPLAYTTYGDSTVMVPLPNSVFSSGAINLTYELGFIRQCTPTEISGTIFNFCTTDLNEVEVTNVKIVLYARAPGSPDLVDGTPCDDGDFCTVGDECLSGMCTPGGPRTDCDDNEPCTIDTCESNMCVFTPLSDNVYLDEFATSGSFLGSDGNIDWTLGGSNAWVETGDDGSAFIAFGTAVGFVSSFTAFGNPGLPAYTYTISALPNPYNTGSGVAIQRLSPITTPMGMESLRMVFDVDVGTALVLNAVLLLEISTDGGSTFGTPVVCYHNANATLCAPYAAISVVDTTTLAMSGSLRTTSMSISAYAGPLMTIRLRVPRCDYTSVTSTDSCAIIDDVEVFVSGSPCDDMNACTLFEMCVAGVCVANDTVDCSHLTTQCADGICNTGDGTCSAVPVMDGTVCDDMSACTLSDTCTSGVCVGTLDCTAFDAVCSTGVCNMTSQTCMAQLDPPGTPCDDLNANTFNDVCLGNGTCAGFECFLFDTCGVCLTEDDPTDTATTIVVNTSQDVISVGDGFISMREAVSIANHRGGTITVDLVTHSISPVISILGDEDENCAGDFDIQ